MNGKKKRIRLKQFRIGLQLTQQEMADKLTMPKDTYVSIENGIREGRANFWAHLQEVFNIPDSEMYSFMKTEERQHEQAGMSESQS